MTRSTSTAPTALPAPADTIPGLLEQRAASHPHEVAHWCSSGARLSYRDWDLRARRAAAGLRARGVREGSVVGALFGPDEWTALSVAYVAIQRCGAACLLLSYQWTDAELATVITTSGCVGVVGGSRLRDGGAGWAETLAELQQIRLGRDETNAARPDSVADILFTSGSTGTPRGIAYCQQNAVFEAPFLGGAVPWSVPGGMCVHAHPPFGAGGQARITLPLIAQLPVYSLAEFSPRALCDVVEAYRAPHVSLVPAMAVELATWDQLGRYDLSPIHVISFGSAPLPPATARSLLDSLPAAVLINQYTSTEALPARIRGRVLGRDDDPVGWPDHVTQVSVRDPDTGRMLPPDDVGEIWLRAPGAVPRWYHNEPDAGGTVFVDGWTRMGDIGRLCPDGSLVLLDRKKDIINRGGIKVSPSEVERVLTKHPGVVDAVVAGFAHPVLGEEVGAAVVLAPGTTCAPTELRQFSAEYLSPAKTPKQIVFVPELPRTGNGKLRRVEITPVLEAAATRHGDAREIPSTPIEARVLAAWENVLQSTVDLGDDFFLLGGDSLRATRIAAALADDGYEISTADLFDHPTVRELATELTHRQTRC